MSGADLICWVVDLYGAHVFFETDIVGVRYDGRLPMARFPERERPNVKVGAYFRLTDGRAALLHDDRPIHERRRAIASAMDRGVTIASRLSRRQSAREDLGKIEPSTAPPPA